VTRYLETFFRNRWLVSIPVLLLLIGGAVAAFKLPPQYEATATIWTDTALYFELPDTDNAYLPPAEIEARRFNELLRTHTFAGAIADRFPNAAQASTKERQQFIERLQQKLQIVSSGDHTIRLNFAHADSGVATAVVQFAIAEYSKVITETAALQAEEAITFYQQQIQVYETELLPRSTNAVNDYLRKYPRAREVGQDGAPLDATFALLSQQARADREAYQLYQQRLNEVQTQSEAANQNQPVTFRIIDEPHVPANSSQINTKLLALLAGVTIGLSGSYMALFLGLATALDRTMRSAEATERTLDMPVLDVIPDYAAGRAARRAAQRERTASIATTIQSKPSM
jgi:uncharacterized protein involved in exopolysaccharide biosynthesis